MYLVPATAARHLKGTGTAVDSNTICREGARARGTSFTVFLNSTFRLSALGKRFKDQAS